MEIFGYTFKNGELLDEALTTPAYRMEKPSAKDNQRLEFLGDAVLGMLAAEKLYSSYPNDAEGSLTVCRARMVSSAALCKVASQHGLCERLRFNRGAERPPENSKTYADAVEAVFGAAYLDGGFDAVRGIFAALELETLAKAPDWISNPKGELQIRAQAMRPQRHPVYKLEKVVGRAHEPIFTMSVSVEGVGIARASARTRREAETHAAALLLEQLIKGKKDA